MSGCEFSTAQSISDQVETKVEEKGEGSKPQGRPFFFSFLFLNN